MSGYSDGGASHVKKTLKTWVPRHYSSLEDIDRNLATLRNRAADLVMNSPVGAAAINTQATNVVGVGLKVFPRINAKVLGMTPEQAREWSRTTKREFEFWANSLGCDFLRRNNFYELQVISLISYFCDGDSFCLFRRRPPKESNPYSLRLQILDAQRVSNPIKSNVNGVGEVEMRFANSHNRIVNGIEVNRDGRLEAIWVCNKIWNEPNSLDAELKWQRVSMFGSDTGCRNILHICFDKRPDQFRGVPLLAPVIETLKQIARYADAELTSAIIKSYFSIFFVQLQQSNLDINQIADSAEDDADKACVNVNEYKLGPATMAALPRGVDVKAIDSANVQSTFDAFTQSFLTQVGASLGLPSEVLLKKFQNNYSASRAALLQAADEFRCQRARFVTDFCQPIYEEFLTEAVALGRIKAPKFFDDPFIKAQWCQAEWHNEVSHFLDPVKETQAMILRLNSGLSTYAAEVAEATGQDFSEIVETLAQERKILSELPPPISTPEVNSTTETDSDSEENSAPRRNKKTSAVSND